MNRFIEIIAGILESDLVVTVLGTVLATGIVGLIKSVIHKGKNIKSKTLRPE